MAFCRAVSGLTELIGVKSRDEQLSAEALGRVTFSPSSQILNSRSIRVQVTAGFRVSSLLQNVNATAISINSLYGGRLTIAQAKVQHARCMSTTQASQRQEQEGAALVLNYFCSTASFASVVNLTPLLPWRQMIQMIEGSTGNDGISRNLQSPINLALHMRYV